MIKRTKRILSLRISRVLEKESDKAVRRFFGTFVKDIKRNWVEMGSAPKTWYHLKLKGKSNVSQLTNPI